MDPTADTGNITPTSVAHIIGQRRVIKQVEMALDAAHIDGRRFENALLTGPPGLGKTTTAKVIACEMAAEMYEIQGQSFKSKSDLNAALLEPEPKDVLFIDEVHQLKKELQTTLYLALDRRAVIVPGGRGKLHSLPIADFSLVMATTDEYRVLQPLRDRMKLWLRFEFYSVADLVGVLRREIRVLQWNVEESVLPAIAERSQGTPRLAENLLDSCYRACRSRGETQITPEHLNIACESQQIDRWGLGPNQQLYLRLLTNGPKPFTVLALQLSEPPQTLRQVTEAFLIRAGLVTKDHQGRRELTAKGKDYVSNSCQNPVAFPSD